MPQVKNLENISKKLLYRKLANFDSNTAIMFSVAIALITLMQCAQLLDAQAVGSKDLFRCRQSCYQKFVQDWHHCMDFEDCKNMCITPPNINSYIPEAFSFLCWNNCDQQLGPFPLNINSALRQGSLVLTDIGWDQAITNASKQCLVTWEVSGGGLMGNLLTDSSTVELSLWPDTVYHVQVTCKHKETGGMRRSYKLIVDTHKLSDSTATGMQTIALDTLPGQQQQHMYGNNAAAAAAAAIAATSSETDSRMRILKDSSKDFLTPYNPNAATSSGSTTTTTTTTTSTSSSSSSSTSKSTTTRSLPPSSSTTAYSTPRGNSVLRTKMSSGLTAGNINGENSTTLPFLTQSIVFAMVGSVVLFFGLLALYVLTRTTPKEVPAGASAIDKEVLIHSELLPSQTHAATAAAANACAATTKTFSSAIFQSSADARTLHV